MFYATDDDIQPEIIHGFINGGGYLHVRLFGFRLLINYRSPLRARAILTRQRRSTVYLQ